MPTFIEEGRYRDISSFPILSKCLSIKFIPDDLGSPELHLFSMSGFSGKEMQLFSLINVELKEFVKLQQKLEVD